MSGSDACEPVGPRTLWPNEARDFTPWLFRNGGLLGEALGLRLRLDAAEQPVGRYRADLIGRDETNDAALVVENQLEQSDMRHFGQVITYAAGRDAGTVVWIATSFRPEHVAALRQWNEDTPEHRRYFALEVVTTRGLYSPSEVGVGFHVVVAPQGWSGTEHSENAARGRTTRKRTSAPRRVASVSTGQYQMLWDATQAVVEERRLGWVGWRLQRDTLVKMKSPLPESWFQFNWYQGVQLQTEFVVYPKTNASYARQVYQVARAAHHQLQAAYGDTDEVLLKAPGENSNKGVAIYVARAATPDEPLEPLRDWLIQSGQQLRAAVATLDLERTIL